MNATAAQLPVRPRRQFAHSPQEIWNGTLTSGPGANESTRVAELEHLRDAFVTERERWCEGELPDDDQRVEVACCDRQRADECRARRSRAPVPGSLATRASPGAMYVSCCMGDSSRCLGRPVVIVREMARTARRAGASREAFVRADRQAAALARDTGDRAERDRGGQRRAEGLALLPLPGRQGEPRGRRHGARRQSSCVTGSRRCCTTAPMSLRRSRT